MFSLLRIASLIQCAGPVTNLHDPVIILRGNSAKWSAWTQGGTLGVSPRRRSVVFSVLSSEFVSNIAPVVESNLNEQFGTWRRQ